MVFGVEFMSVWVTQGLLGFLGYLWGFFSGLECGLCL